MRTIEQIRALLLTEKDESKRNELLDELQQAIEQRKASGSEPTKVEQLRSQLQDITTRRDGLLNEFEQITTSAVDGEGNAREFTADEAEQRGSLRARIDLLNAEHTSVQDQVRQAEHDDREERMNAQVAQMRRDLGLGERSRGLDGVQVRELPVYSRRGGVSFVKDLALRGFGPGLGSAWSQACERLGQHGLQNHQRALELDEREARLDEQARGKFARSAEGYFLRQMVEAVQDRENQAGPNARGTFLSYRALSTASGAGGEFTPPLFLTEDWIKFLRAGRVVANNCRHFDLPDGTMVINIPKVLSGVSVDVQGTQNTNVSMTDITTAFVTVPVVTVAGAQIISLQLLERSPIHFDEVIWGDLAAAQAQRMDLQVLNGTGANGQMTGILNTSGINTVTWTFNTSTTVAKLMGQVGLAKVDIATAIFRPATHGFMTPYVWEWVGQSVDGNQRPLVVPEYNGPFNAAQIAPDAATAEGAVGRRFSGLDLYEDANIPANLGGGSNQSVVLVSRMEENFLYESPVVTRALPQTLGLQMSVILQLYGYAAFSAARYPTANSVVTGTALASTNLTYNS